MKTLWWSAQRASIAPRSGGSPAAITDIRFALVLREDYGWSPDRIESWMASTSRTLLLEPSPGD